jgi:hypothetical protein
MRDRSARVVAAALALVSLVGCRPDAAVSATSPRAAEPQPTPRKRSDVPVEQVRDWTRLQRPTPTARDRNPFSFGPAVSRGAGEAPIAPGVSPDSLPELPLPIPASDLRLIGVAGAEGPDERLTAIVTVGNDLVLARAGDTIAARYRVVRVGEESLDVIDAVGNQPRHFSLR